MLKLRAKELRKAKPVNGEDKLIKRNPIYFVLDNVLDTYNIGSIFRLADAVAAEKIFICGNSEYPPSSRIHKAAVGTEAWVPWSKEPKTLDICQKLKSKGVQIISIEQNKKSLDYRKINKQLINFPIALVVGHETEGISQEVLEISDLIIELPMYGINNSLNVWGSLAIITYKMVELL